MRLKDFRNRVWNFRLEGEACQELSQCGVEIPTESSEDEQLNMNDVIMLNWHDSTTWESLNGPHWINSDGIISKGIPEAGSTVIIPEGIIYNII